MSTNPPRDSNAGRTTRKFDPSEWLELIDMGLKFREKTGDSTQWDKWKAYYSGNYSNSAESELVPVNMTFANGKLLIPKSYFRNPRVKVTPARPEYFYQSFIVDSVINQLIRELRIKWQLKQMIEDAYTTGTSFGKLGFDSEFGYLPEDTLTDTTTDKKAEKIEYNINVKQGMPWFLWCDANDIIVPWGAATSGDPEITDIPWIAHRIVREVADIKADSKYKNTSDLSGTFSKNLDKRIFQEGSSLVEYAELWEIRSYRDKMIRVVARGHDKVLLEEDDPLQIEGFPYTKLIFNAHPRYFWGISDVKNLEPHQLSLNVANTIFIHHVRMALKKIAFQSGSIKPDQIMNLLSDRFSATVEVEGNINEVLKELNITIPQDIIVAMNEIRKTIRELVGYSRNEAGEYDQSTRRTATEANLVKMGSETRSSERRDQVADVLESVARKLFQIVSTHWTKEQVVPIIGDDGVQYWVEFSPDEIRGEYQFNINAEEAQPIDSAKVTEDALGLLKQLQEDPDFSPEERKKIKIMLLSQFTHLGYDMEKALAPREGVGGSQQQPIPMREFAAGMEKGKRRPGGGPELQQALQSLQGGGGK